MTADLALDIRHTVDMRRQLLAAAVLVGSVIFGALSGFYVLMVRVERDLSPSEELITLSGPWVMFLVGLALWTSGWMRWARARLSEDAQLPE